MTGAINIKRELEGFVVDAYGRGTYACANMGEVIELVSSLFRPAAQSGESTKKQSLDETGTAVAPRLNGHEPVDGATAGAGGD